MENMQFNTEIELTKEDINSMLLDENGNLKENSEDIVLKYIEENKLSKDSFDKLIDYWMLIMSYKNK